MKKTGIDKPCERCGAVFYVAQWELSRPGRQVRFCSRACRYPNPMTAEEKRAARKLWRAADHRRHRAERLVKFKTKYAANREAISAERKRRRAAETTEEKLARHRKRRAERGDRVRAYRRADYRRNKPKYLANARKRERHIKRATPPWADLKAIEAFYFEADRLTRETGVKHHVDHIHPLKSPVLCGLHVETNLQIIPAIENLRKSNRI